jgi:hypothetical protein
MTVQVGSKPPTRSTVPTVIAHSSNIPHGASTVRDLPRRRQSEHLGKQIANHAPGTTKKNGRRITRFLAAGGVALVIGSSSLFTGACTAAADRLDVVLAPDLARAPPSIRGLRRPHWPPHVVGSSLWTSTWPEIHRTRAARGEIWVLQSIRSIWVSPGRFVLLRKDVASQFRHPVADQRGNWSDG